MTKKVNIVFYVDIEDNTKGCLCAIPTEKDMRSQEIVSEIAETICKTFAWDLLVCDHSTEIAKSIAYHGFSGIDEYEFGIEEIDFIS